MRMVNPRPLSPADPTRNPRAALFALCAGAAALFVAAGMLAGRALGEPPGPAPDRCALPDGIDLRALGAAERDRIAERAMLCADVEHGRLPAAEYRARIAAMEQRAAPAAPLPEVVWASSVRQVSSQYSEDSWSAAKVLGPPDALPAGQDNASAWASAEADRGEEFIEVAFDRPHRMSGLDIHESFNPGAVSRVELLLAGGGRVAVQPAGAVAQPVAFLRRVDFACTDQPVVGVRVTLNSAAVPGWNEIDAIGGHPCGD
jgi:hypothetical protein